MKITRKPTFSEQKLKDGKYRTTYSVQIDGKEFKTEIISRNPQAGRDLARMSVTNKVTDKYPNEAHTISGNVENIPGAGLAQQETPEEARFRSEQLVNPYQEGQQSSIPTSENNSISDVSNVSDDQAASLLRKTQNTQKKRRNTHQRSQKQKNHVPWPENAFGTKYDGIGDASLHEPVPKFFLRPGERIIEGENNTAIVLGRDRSPTNQEIFSKNVENRSYTSGYSDYMCAGAIDIVVGRMAPFPVTDIGALNDFVLSIG